MRFRIIFILMIASLSASAQHDHYVYIQGDNQQIFYIRKGTEVISSSQSGFIILPKLQPGQQDFQVGFPKNEFPEYQFTFELRSKDRGFTLKNFNEKGWGLFDLQSMEVIMGRKVEAKKETTKVEIGPVTDDAFSVILASAVDDPRIRETSLVYREPAATPSNAVVKTETPPVTTAPVNTTTEKQKPPTSSSEQQTVKDSKVISPPVSSEQQAAKDSKAVPPPVSSEQQVAKDSKLVPPPVNPEQQAAKDYKPANQSAGEPEANKSKSAAKEPVSSKPSGSQPAAPAVTGTAVVKTADKGKKDSAATAVASNKPVPDKPVAEQEKQQAKKDSVSAAEVVAVNSATQTEKETSSVSDQQKPKSHIVKFSEYERDGEVNIVFIDHQFNRTDTIRVSIVEVTNVTALVDSVSRDSVKTIQVDSATMVSKKPAAKGKGQKKNAAVAVVPVTTTKKEDSIATSVTRKADTVTTAVKSDVRTDCKRMATDKDMVAMRKKMVMMTDEDEMISAALRDIKSKCYTTERIQNLSYVFTTDKGRYKLFDAAHPYVYDPTNYVQLERLLNQDYYINRFRALINQK